MADVEGAVLTGRCCECGVGLDPAKHPTMTCVACLSARADIAEGVCTTGHLFKCRRCGKYAAGPTQRAPASKIEEATPVSEFRRATGRGKTRMVRVRVAAPPRLPRGYSVETGHGGAAGAACAGRRAGEGTRARAERSTDSVGSGRLRRGCHVDMPRGGWSRPLPRGYAAGPARIVRTNCRAADAAAAGSCPQYRRGWELSLETDRTRHHDVAGTSSASPNRASSWRSASSASEASSAYESRTRRGSGRSRTACASGRA